MPCASGNHPFPETLQDLMFSLPAVSWTSSLEFRVPALHYYRTCCFLQAGRRSCEHLKGLSVKPEGLNHRLSGLQTQT